MSRKKPPRFEFTIVAGELKGRRITAPDLGITRPPLTRIRRSLFDFLGPYLTDAEFLDLYSGTGSYLFEAVSRGAAHATGVERDPRLVVAINEQAEKLGLQRRLVCERNDVIKAIGRFHEASRWFDIITLAPPQYRGLIGQTLRTMQEYPILGQEGLIVCQHDTKESGDFPSSPFSLLERRTYGNTTLTVLGPPA